MKTSYKKEDVTVLLKDITGMIDPLTAAKREKLIQSGTHYSELLPEEYKPTKEYIRLYEEALEQHALTTARAVAILSEKIWAQKGDNLVLVSLARAGTPIGILIKRYLKLSYQVDIMHYTISIVRDRGLDTVAMDYLLNHHQASSLQFVDGWIGKGAIINELRKEVKKYKGVSGELAVLADPAAMTQLYGTSEDFLIPSACLNAPVSGLFSRTVWNDEVIGTNDFHGSVYYSSMEDIDVSYAFIQTVESYFPKIELGQIVSSESKGISGMEEVENIAKEFHITNINLIKPGIGETTRVLLRRVPWKILIKDKTDISYIGHILRLCQEKQVEIVEYPLLNYRACGIIKQMADI